MRGRLTQIVKLAGIAAICLTILFIPVWTGAMKLNEDAHEIWTERFWSVSLPGVDGGTLCGQRPHARGCRGR